MTTKGSNGNGGQDKYPPPLPLIPEKVEALDDQKVIFKLLSNPADANSTKYSFSVNLLNGGESLRTAISLHRNLLKVLAGLALVDGESQAAICRQLLKGQALSCFDAAFADSRAEAWEVAREAARNTERANVSSTPASINAAAAAASGVSPGSFWEQRQAFWSSKPELFSAFQCFVASSGK